MVNEINGSLQSVIKNLTANTQSDKKPAGNDAGAGHARQGNEVNLTDTSARLLKLEKEIGSQPVVDVQRVEKLRQSIADGSFEVNASRTAGKLAEFEGLLGGKVGKK